LFKAKLEIGLQCPESWIGFFNIKKLSGVVTMFSNKKIIINSKYNVYWMVFLKKY
jgi:hypothetical protein